MAQLRLSEDRERREVRIRHYQRRRESSYLHAILADFAIGTIGAFLLLFGLH
jgi:hypothetical protein